MVSQLIQKVQSIKLDKQLGLICFGMSVLFGPYAVVAAAVLAKTELKAAIMLAALQWASIVCCGAGYVWAVQTCYKIYKNAESS